MKKVNQIAAVMVLLIITALTGCSDEITSAGDLTSRGKGKPVVEPVDRNLSYSDFRTSIKIEPQTSYTFNASNTPYTKLTSVDIDRVYEYNNDELLPECENLVVYASTLGKKYSIGCQASNINSEQITIENTSPETVQLKVVLTGVKVKKVYEFDSE